MAQIANLEKRIEIMKKGQDNIVKFSVDSLDPETEDLLYEIVRNIADKAAKAAWGGDANIDLIMCQKQKICYICEKPMSKNIETWYSDSFGNIVHEKCYQGGNKDV